MSGPFFVCDGDEFDIARPEVLQVMRCCAWGSDKFVSLGKRWQARWSPVLVQRAVSEGPRLGKWRRPREIDCEAIGG